MQDFDSLYGKAMPPVSVGLSGAAVYAWETDNLPKSLTVLTEKNANFFKQLLDSVVNGFRINETAYRGVRILWLVKEDGAIVFAIEELVNEQLQASGIPSHLLIRADPAYGKKLGHPSLVHGGSARIAGEIYYSSERLKWFINGSSGRYSLTQGRSEENLSNVAELFKKFGIEFEIDSTSLKKIIL